MQVQTNHLTFASDGEICLEQIELLKRRNVSTTANCFKTHAQISTNFTQSNHNITISNIVLLGPTGVGKSYFLNGLLGYTNPNVGIFPVGISSESCTRKISSVTGEIFNGKLKNYGIDNILIKVFDTPGKG